MGPAVAIGSMDDAPNDGSGRDAVTELLGDPDEAILRLARRPQSWIALYCVYVLVVVCFVVGGYPTNRTAASSAVLFGILPVVLLAAFRKGDDRHRWQGGTLLWTVAAQNVLAVAMTGGLHSPHALATFVVFSSLYARYGWSRAGQLVFALFCGGVAWLAVVPRSWTGPALAEPWFTVAASVAMIGSLAVQAQFVRVLRQTATDAIEATLRARDELAEQALARARELELVGSKLSHELNNPLAAIKGLVQVVHRSSLDPLVHKQLGVVEREVERMAFTLQGYLGFTRPLDGLEPVEAELAEVGDSVLALLEGRARAAAVSLERKGHARASVDAKRLRGALINLVANAIDACPRGGRVELVVADDGGNVRVTVVDNGRGMAPDVVQRLGTPFFTTRERGTGLGVVLARAAFEQHGGTLEYRSAPGRGTIVVGTLPRRRAA